jgi:hypothetical protein
MEDDFYASIKLISGEEIFARVMPCVQETNFTLLLNNPVTFSEIKHRNGVTGYKIEPWLKTNHEDMVIISMDKVITISETTDSDVIETHQSFVRKFNSIKNKTSTVTRKMGYISSVKDAKTLLEKIYKDY